MKKNKRKATQEPKKNIIKYYSAPAARGSVTVKLIFIHLLCCVVLCIVFTL